MKQGLALLLAVSGLVLSFSSGFVFANDESICVDRPYRVNAPASLDVVDDFTGTARLTLEQRIDFVGNTGTKESIGHERNVTDQSLQEQFCSEYIVIMMGTADQNHLNELDGLTGVGFEKDTRFASCTFVNLVPNKERADVVAGNFGDAHYLSERTKYLIDTPTSTALETFFDYPSAFEGRESDNTIFPYYMIIGQNGRVVEDGNGSQELLQEMAGYCRSYDCDGTVTNTQLPSDAEIDVDNDGLANNDPLEYDIDGDNQSNVSNTERHARGDIDGDGAKNLYDMDIDCDGIPNDQDDSPLGSFEAPEQCGDGTVDIGQTEICDDGNGIDGDACTNLCRDARCGDGIVWIGVEACDDGNTNNFDGCSNECLSESCGDGIKQNGFEQCDDGNAVNGDGCSGCMKDPGEEPDPIEPPENEPTPEQPGEGDPGGNPTSGTNTGGVDGNVDGGDPGGNPTSGTNTGGVDGNVDGGDPGGNPTSGTNTGGVDGNIDGGQVNGGDNEGGNTTSASTTGGTDTGGENTSGNTVGTDGGASTTGETTGETVTGETGGTGDDDGDGSLPFPIGGPGGPAAGNAGNSGGETNGGLQKLTCEGGSEGEYQRCLASCQNGKPQGGSLEGSSSGGSLDGSDPGIIAGGTNGGSTFFTNGLVYAQSETTSCEATCKSKLQNCNECVKQSGGNEHACACKHFDHIYLNTDIPFIGQCILKRPALEGEVVSSTSLPNLDTAFPRVVSGISRLLQSLVLVLAFMAVVIAGFMMSAGGMSAEAKSKGMSILKGVIIALVLLGASGIILNLINPNFFTTDRGEIGEQVELVERNRESEKERNS